MGDSTQPGTTAGLPTKAFTIVKGVVASAVALAGAITAIAAALYIVAPQLEPREKLGAELDRVSLQQGVEHRDYRYQQGPVPDDEEDPLPGIPGVTVLVHAKLSGYEDRSYTVDVSAVDAETLVAVEPPPGLEFTATCENRSPQADEDGVAWRCWMAAPPRGTEYLVRAQLYDHGKTKELQPGEVKSRELLDFMDSEVVTSVRGKRR